MDPFTKASPTYQNAMRYKHKSGPAFEGYRPGRTFRARLVWIMWTAGTGFLGVILTGILVGAW